MPTVTAITAQRRSDRVNIHLDGAFWRGAPIAVVVDAGLKVGRELSDAEVEDLAQVVLVREAIESCLRRLALRGRTRRELAQGLRERKFDEDIAERALAHLDGIGMLDDAPVARQRAEALLARGDGARKIGAELSRLGIDPDTREQVLDEVVTYEAQMEGAGRVVRRKFGDAPYAASVHARAERWLRAHGHGAEVISELIGRPVAEITEDDSAPAQERTRADVDAAALLRRKYPRAHIDAGERRRATAFLQRRGVGYEDIRLAVEALGEEP